MRWLGGAFIGSFGTAVGLSMLEVRAFSTPDHGLHAPHYPFSFHKWNLGYDHAALRRGYQVCILLGFRH